MRLPQRCFDTDRVRALGKNEAEIAIRFGDGSNFCSKRGGDLDVLNAWLRSRLGETMNPLEHPAGRYGDHHDSRSASPPLSRRAPAKGVLEDERFERRVEQAKGE